jgi:hypothetical protein
MHGLNLRYRHLGKNVSLSKDLAERICERASYGKIVVVASNPTIMLSSVRKQYLRIIYRLQVERSRTLQSEQGQSLSNELARMRNLSFTTKLSDTLEANITFATADEVARSAPECSTLYVTYDFPKERLHLMTSWMPKNGQVVLYEQR